MDRETVLQQYEILSIGKRSTLRLWGNSDDDFIQSCITLIKYIIKLCKWTPREAAERMSPELMQKMHVDEIYRYLSMHGGVEPGIRPSQDFKYLAWLAYPNEVDYSFEERTLKVYRDRMTDKIKKFPDYFFDGDSGQIRASYCLREAVRYLHVSSIEELYEIFADPVKGKNIVLHARLSKICDKFFNSPLDFLHYSLADTQRNEELYQKCKKEMEKKLVKKQVAESKSRKRRSRKSKS